MAAPAWDIAIAPSTTLGSAPATQLGTAGQASYWLSIANRSMRQAASSAGKQYELDQAQTGELQVLLDNRDAALSPVNSVSPYAPNVGPFRPIRWRAQYPASINILTVDQATGGSMQAAGLTVDAAVPPWFSYVAFWTVKAEGDAYTGPNVFQQVVSVAQSAPFSAGDMNGWSIRPGQWHSAQCVMRATAGGTTPQARLTLIWRDINGAVLSSVNGGTVTLTANSRVWQRLTVSAQAPAGACGATLQIVMVNSVAVTWQASGFQVEYATTPSAWVTPGTWWSIHTGGAERWPQAYGMDGSFGQAQPTSVDAFSLLSQVYPPPCHYSEVLALTPAFFFPLDDPATAVSFHDQAGNYSPAPVVSSPQGAGTVAPGQGIQTNQAGWDFIGGGSTITTFTNPNLGSSVTFTSCSWIQLDKVGIAGPPATGGWTRQIAWRNTGAGGAGGSAGSLWNSSNPSYAGIQNLFSIMAGATPTAGISVTVASATAGSSWSGAVGTYADGLWNMMHIVMSADNKTLTIYVNASVVYTNTTATSQNPIGIVSDVLGAIVYPGVGQNYDGYNGDLADVAQWNAPLTAGQILIAYNGWRFAFRGESTDSRYSRILRYAGYKAPVVLQAGTSRSMGPATDIDGRTTALTLLENVVTTESGVHYVAGDGTLTFEARANRYNKLTPTYTFGERTDLGEWPYETVAFDFDSTHVVGQAQITQNSTGQLFVANSTSTLAPGYRPTFQRTINVTNPQECVDAANYIANRFAKPALRVQAIRLHPAAVAGMWPVALALKISMRVRVMRRAPGVPAIQFDGFIESVKWSADWDNGDVLVDLEISPADTNLYWVNAALHTTSRASMSSGTNSITLNPIPGESVNPFPVCSGLQLTLDPGGALVETLTVSSVAGGIPLAPNGSFVVDTSGWLGSNSATMAQSLTAGPGYPQGPLSAVTITSTQNVSASGLQAAAAQSGFVAASVYLFQAWVKPSATSTFTTNVDWYNVSSVYVSTTTVTVSNVQGGQWTQLATSHTAPATATKGIMYVLGGIMPVAATFAITDIFVGLPPTVTFTAAAANTHTSGITVCEALPAGITDPTTWDTAALIGVSTTPSY